MSKNTAGRTLTAAEVAAIPAGAKYRCIACGHWSRNVAEAHAHTATAHARKEV